MKWIRIALWLLLAVGLMGQTPTATPTVVPGAPPSCAINGVVVNPDGSPFANGTINFNSKTVQIISGVPVYPTIVNTNTDALGNIAAILLPQGLFMQVTMCPSKAQASQCSAPFTALVPASATSTFGTMITGPYPTQPIPNGSTNQIFGVNNANIPEWETVGGDGTFAWTSAGHYALSVTKVNGVSGPFLTGAPASITDTMLVNPYSGVGACTGGQLVSGLNRNAAPTCVAPPVGFTAGGDLSGTATSQTVIGIRSTSVPALASGYLHYNGSAFVWDTPGSGSFLPVNNPTFTGTLTAPNGGTWNAAGIHNINNLQLATGGDIFLDGTLGGYIDLHFQNTPSLDSVWDQTGIYNLPQLTIGGAASNTNPGINIRAGTYQYGGVNVGGTCTAGQYISALSGTLGITCTTPSGGSGYPSGSPPQFGGFSATNTAEAETLGGDATFSRTGANAYSITVTKTSGTAFGTAATQNTGTSGATIPLLNAANTWGAGAIQTLTNGGIQLLGSNSGYTVFNSNNASTTNYTVTFPANTGTLAETNLAQTWSATQTFSSPPVMSGANINSATIPTASLVYPTRTATVSWIAGANPANGTLFYADHAMTIVSLTGMVEVAAGATATISVVKANGTTLASGTVIHSGSFNANGTAGTYQPFTLTVTTLAAGDRLGLTTTGSWTAAVGSISVVVQ